MLVAASIAAAWCYDSMPHHRGPMEALWEAFELDHRVCGDPFLFFQVSRAALIVRSREESSALRLRKPHGLPDRPRLTRCLVARGGGFPRRLPSGRPRWGAVLARGYFFGGGGRTTSYHVGMSQTSSARLQGKGGEDSISTRDLCPPVRA